MGIDDIHGVVKETGFAHGRIGKAFLGLASGIVSVDSNCRNIIGEYAGGEIDMALRKILAAELSAFFDELKIMIGLEYFADEVIQENGRKIRP